MGDIDWTAHSDDEVIRACTTAPRIFGPWEPWDGALAGCGWSRREVFPGPSWKSGGSVSVRPCTYCPGFDVSWRDGSADRYANGFASAEEAMRCGDEWLRAAGHRLK